MSLAISFELLSGPLGQRADVVGDHGEAAALLAGARRFDGGVEREQVGLAGNVVDGLDDAADLLTALAELFDLACGHVDSLADGLERLHGAPDLLLAGRGLVLGARGQLIDEAGLARNRADAGGNRGGDRGALLGGAGGAVRSLGDLADRDAELLHLLGGDAHGLGLAAGADGDLVDRLRDLLGGLVDVSGGRGDLGGGLVELRGGAHEARHHALGDVALDGERQVEHEDARPRRERLLQRLALQVVDHVRVDQREVERVGADVPARLDVDRGVARADREPAVDVGVVDAAIEQAQEVLLLRALERGAVGVGPRDDCRELAELEAEIIEVLDDLVGDGRQNGLHARISSRSSSLIPTQLLRRARSLEVICSLSRTVIDLAIVCVPPGPRGPCMQGGQRLPGTFVHKLIQNWIIE